MSKSHRRRRPFDHSFQVDGLLSLEPRQLFTVYDVLSNNVEAFGLNEFIRTIAAPDGVENFGYDTLALGDINADGRPDFAISAPGRVNDPLGRWGGDNADEGPAGRVFIYSGADLSLIRTLSNESRGFGASMAAVGDLDGDGVADLVVGSPSYDANDNGSPDCHGRITVYSGATGGIMSQIDGAGRYFEFGYSMQAVGDFDGDGKADIIVGAPGASSDTSVLGPGQAFVYSLVTSALLRTFTGEVAGDRFGHAVAGGFDIPLTNGFGTGDGFKDFIVGAPSHDSDEGADAGRVYVFNGQTGAQFTNSPLGDGVPAEVTGLIAKAGDRFGSSVGYLGANADGLADAFLFRLLVGAPGADVSIGGLEPLADRGQVYGYSAWADVGVFHDSNISFSQTPDPQAGDHFGERIIRLADFIMADGISEFAVLAPGNTQGHRLNVFNGNFTNLYASGVTGAGAYSSAALVGDLDNDGQNDFVFGQAPADDPAGVPFQAQVVPFTLASGSIFVGPISDDGNYAVVGGYIAVNGRPRTMAEMGLQGLTVGAVNNAGLFFASNGIFTGGFADTQNQFLVQNGARTSLAQAITSIVGPTPTTSLNFQSMSNTGDIVFVASNNQSYLFRAGQLIYLWEGFVGHVNDSGVVVGVGPLDRPGGPTPDIGGTGRVRMFTADGQIVDIDGLRTTGLGRFIDNLGRIYGHSDAGDLLMWENGTLTTIARFADLGLEGTFGNWSVADVDEMGKVAATVRYSIPSTGRPPSASPSANYFFEPGAGFRGTGLVIPDPLGLPPPSGSGYVIDRLITGNALLVANHLAVPQPRAGAVTTAEDHPINVTWTNRGLDIAVSSVGGQGIVLRLTGQQAGLWLAAPLPLASAAIDPPGIVPEVNLYTDPRDGRSYAIVRLDSQLVWFTQDFEGVYDSGRVLPTPAAISSNLAIFTSADNRVHIVGLTAGGDVIMVFQFNVSAFQPTDLENWGSVNLTTDHLDPQGQETPRFTSDLTAYVAPWNGLNIAGIDDTGRVHTVWWAPGLTYWQTSDLSEIAGAPVLTGNITSYVTSWSGLNVAGTTADGKVATLWWVPQFGGEWRFDVLMPETPRGLREGTLSAYVTSWGGLNIAGIDPETGKLAVYWWTPTTPWAYENITVAGGSPTIEGRVTAIATPPGQLDVLARGENDELLRFYWNPGDASVWSVEDVGARAL